MDGDPREQLKRVWNNPSIPVLYRRGPSNHLLARLPYDPTNRSWLRASGRKNPMWLSSKKYWELPQAWFNDLVKRCIEKYGRVYIIQPFRAQDKCAPACWNAEGEICECSCMGAYHGSGHPSGRWKIVSETFATRWNGRELACRLLTRPSKV
jgi:hypothetical protein